MPKYHFCAQRSDEWDNLRLGIPTASSFDKIITPSGAKCKTQTTQNYAHSLLSEICLKRRMDTYMSPAMEIGQMLEEDAVRQYQMTRGDVKMVGFVTNDEGKIGCSPDGLVGENGLLEIKCPKPNTLIGYIIHGGAEDEYKPQLQGQLYVTEREWVDLYTHHPEIPAPVVRVYRDEKYIAKMADLLAQFNEYIYEGILKIAKFTEVTESPLPENEVPTTDILPV